MEAIAKCIVSTNLCCRSWICEHIKLFLSSVAVTLLLIVVVVGISLEYCVLQAPPAVNFILLFLALTLLAYCEALHYAVVAVEKWDMAKYAEKFPRAVKCHALVDTPEKVKKFLVGRQFFTIFVVFLISEITSFPGIPPNFAGMPNILVKLLVQTGLPGVALVLTFGQLVSQIYVEEFTLPFLNLYGCNLVIRLSLAAEYIGICNFSWLLYFIVSRVVCRRVIKAKKIIDSNKSTMSTTDENPSRYLQADEALSPTEKIRGPNFDLGIPKQELTLFDLFKYLWSTCATLGSLAIVIYGIIIKSYVLPVPVGGAFIIALLGISTLFVLEGLMIAIVGTQYWDPEEFKEYYPRAYLLHKIINQPDNVKRFIIGRQFCTVLTNFMLAQIFTFANFKNTGYNPILFFIIIKSGLVGVLVTLAFGQLMPELLAAEFPLRFMNMISSVIIGITSLIFDAIGVGHAAWTVYFVTRRLCCGSRLNTEDKTTTASEDGETEKPKIVRVNSAEILALSMKEKKNRSGSNNV